MYTFACVLAFHWFALHTHLIVIKLLNTFFILSLRVTTSIYSVPSICAQDQISDWFDSLAECLHWNVRKRQKHFEELSDLTHSKYDNPLDSTSKDNYLLTTGKYSV